MGKDLKTAPAKNVDEYLDHLPGEVHSMLEELRKSIMAAAPKAEEIISYRIPTYKYLGPLVHFAAFPDHCSLIVVNKDIIKIFEQELQTWKTTGTTIHFTPRKRLPSSLVKKIVKLRMQQNEELEAIKKSIKRKEK